MTADFLTGFDMVRSLFTILIAYFMVCDANLPRRSRFGIRIAAACTVCLVYALLWIPLYDYLVENQDASWTCGLPYYAVSWALELAAAWFCFEMDPGELFFRAMIAMPIETIANILLKYLFVMMWFPEIQEKHFGYYLILIFALYAAVYYLGYELVVRKISQAGRGMSRMIAKKETVENICMYLLYMLVTAMIQTICESTVVPLENDSDLASVLLTIRYFCILSIVLLSVLVLFMTYTRYVNLTLEQQRNSLDRILKEKKLQYELTRENMDLINRKAHDMKHQLAALEMAGEAERSQLIEETRKTVEMYDSGFRTGNEVLDTILTEKSMICTKNSIRISCMANPEGLDRISVVDLYTMLGNALDNAMEAVMEIQNPEKRSINLHIGQKGSMIVFQIENYYDGRISMQNGYPVTHKKDTANHGFGVRSIEQLAVKYGGAIQIDTEGSIFRLKILIPDK